MKCQVVGCKGKAVAIISRRKNKLKVCEKHLKQIKFFYNNKLLKITLLKKEGLFFKFLLLLFLFLKFLLER